MNCEVNLKELEEDILCGKRIVLVLGAGVNYSSNIRLQWDQLLNPLFEHALKHICSSNNYTKSQTEDLLWLFGIESNFNESNANKENDVLYRSLKNKVSFDYNSPLKTSIAKSVLKSRYIYILQDIIYNQCNHQIISNAFRSYRVKQDYNIDIENTITTTSLLKRPAELYTLYTVARAIILNPNIVSVITYNYDNFLKQAVEILLSEPQMYFTNKEIKIINRRKQLGKSNKAVQLIDVYGNSLNESSNYNSVFVFHPHGYIPPPSESSVLDKYKIVFSQDEYNESTWESYSWTNDTQVHLISHYTTIIIGSSFSDMTTQRMAHYSKRNGSKTRMYYLDAYEKSQSDSDIEIARNNLLHIKTKHFESIGLTPIVDQKGFSNLFIEFNKIINKLVDILYANEE